MNPPGECTRRVIAQEVLSETARMLVLERNGFDFRAGQEVYLHGPEPHLSRQYSVASGEADDVLRLLYRIIPTGRLTPWLATLAPGDDVRIVGPAGRFVVGDVRRPMVFIATGTGIAPCLSYARTHPELPLTVLHGVREATEDLTAGLLGNQKVQLCCSGGEELPPGGFAGRVTDYLREHSIPGPEGARYHLCGANAMILEVRRILRERGIPDRDIRGEAYYFG